MAFDSFWRGWGPRLGLTLMLAVATAGCGADAPIAGSGAAPGRGAMAAPEAGRIDPDPDLPDSRATQPANADEPVLLAHENASSRRYALVFGNGAYAHGDALGAPPGDAALVASALQQRGYQVMLARDRGLDEMREDLYAFRDLSDGAEVRVLYFAGHGFEFDGVNYLMPVDLPASIGAMDRMEVGINALRLDQATSELEQGAETVVAIIDACRVVPARGIASARGLQAATPHNGTVLAFATGPGQVASDSLRAYGVDQDHSPYAWFLADALASPEMRTWDQVFLAVHGVVATQTRGQQEPWVNAKVSSFPAVGNPVGATQPDSTAALLGIRSDPRRRALGRYWAREAEQVRRLARDAVPDATLKRRAGDGDLRAALALAERRWDEPGRAADLTARLQPLAEQGNALAQLDLGTHLYRTRTADSRGRSAAYWWKLASAQGLGEARAKLAMLEGRADPAALQEFMSGVFEMHAAGEDSE